MKVAVVQIDSECGAWGDVDHLALGAAESTMCGKPFDRVTRRERLRDTSDRTPCFHCQAKARERIDASLRASLQLFRIADLDTTWDQVKSRAGV